MEIIEEGQLEYTITVNRNYREKEDGSKEFIYYHNEEIPVVPQTTVILRDRNDIRLIVSAFEGYDVLTLVKLGAITSYFHRAERAMHGINGLVSPGKDFPQKDTVRRIICRIRQYIERTRKEHSMNEDIQSRVDNLELEFTSRWGDALVRTYRMRNKFIAHHKEGSPSHEKALEDDTHSSGFQGSAYFGTKSPSDDFENVLGRAHYFYGTFGILYNNLLALERVIEESNE